MLSRGGIGLLGLVLGISACRAADHEWSRFRGPNGSGVADSSAVPNELNTEANLQWKIDSGSGVSSPILAGRRIFFTSFKEDNRMVHCLDATSGQALWTRSQTKLHDENSTEPNGPATPTPVTDGDALYAFFPDTGLIAYTMSGEQLWQRDLEPFHSMHGIASSLTLANELLIVVADQLQSSYMAAFDRGSGDQVWKVDRPDGLTGAHSTPGLFQPPAGPLQLVVNGPLELAGYDAASGKKLWWVTGASNAPAALPIIADGRVFISEPVAERMSLSLIGGMDKNKDGKIALEEIHDSIGMVRLLERVDKEFGNGDNVVNDEEFTRAFDQFVDRGGLVAVDLKGTGDLTRNVRWTYRRQVPYIPSVLVYNGVLYFVQDSGILTALDAKDGTVLKRGRLQAGGQYYASPVAASDKIYLVNTDGKVTVLRAGADWQALSTTDLAERCYATPAISGGRIYVRTNQHLFCFQ